ncbi:hypothetical protein QOQ01_004411 [Salmonella enterica]|uniref:hypothetical protein n=1 Tax=Salmonella enterica TaxID=28901 RepID=UPI0009A99199|nr:hypothetical protein [Salmonella enterica]AXC66454.1 hypothetical protein DOE63_13435 [Salmonella enterica subsp. diarizonae serovar 59:z10:-]ECF6102478.1 hypothetical protein [Salmonella enterica subsp. diarizonae]HCM1647950.1 hypothetical protein [Salmonella enterica subsp. diarizonae serovar 48:i:z35]EAP3674071.1 hypothetical protein [Salmonella enterica]EBB1559118.1 hypothetical protein [Salmonella enterica]
MADIKDEIALIHQALLPLSLQIETSDDPIFSTYFFDASDDVFSVLKGTGYLHWKHVGKMTGEIHGPIVINSHTLLQPFLHCEFLVSNGTDVIYLFDALN